MKYIRTHPFKTLLFLTWFVLLGLLVNRDFLVPTLSSTESQLLTQARQESYYGIWFQRKRIGYVVEQLEPLADNTYRLRQKANLNLKVLKTVQAVNMDLEAALGPDFVMRTFEFSFSSKFYMMKAQGRVEGNRVHFSMDTGQSSINDVVTLSDQPLPPLNQRAYLLKKLPEMGDKIEVTSFDPLSLTGKKSTVEYMGRDKQLIKGKIYNLFHFTETFSGIKVSFWLNDTGKVIKEVSPAGFTFIAEPKFKAKDIADSSDDLLDAVAIKYTGVLPDRNDTSVAYKLTLPAGFEGSLQGGRQQLAGDILNIQKEAFPEPQGEITDFCNRSDLLVASRYVQVDDPEISATAREIVGGETDPAKQVELLCSWVWKTLDKRSVLGLPDALSTLRSKRGDCNEHAALFAALARSLSIPTAITTGVVHYKDGFYYHAWNEVCINGRRISLDSTNNQLPADLTHIRFGLGDTDQELQIGALLGKLHLEILPASQEKK